MKNEGTSTCDATQLAQDKWEKICEKESKDRVWSQVNNWYNKGGVWDLSGNYWGKIYDYMDYIEELRGDGLVFA